MTTSAITHTRIARMARRISASSDSPLAPPKASPSILELLGHARLRAHVAGKAVI